MQDLPIVGLLATSVNDEQPDEHFSIDLGTSLMQRYLNPLLQAQLGVEQLIDPATTSAPVSADRQFIDSTKQVSFRLLLVEDDHMDAEILQRALRGQYRYSFEVDQAATLADAITKLQSTDYDVCLVDLNLPDASGSESFERLRSFDSRLPIIVLTGCEDEDLAIRAIQCGAQDYIAKGVFTPQSLVRVIRFAIVRHEMLQGFKEAADSDPLTGMPNRRNLSQRYGDFIHTSAESGFDLWVALIDIDHFKHINDQHGHCVGDRVLKNVATTLMRSCPADFWCGRFGGEEFAVLMLCQSESEAFQHAQRMLDELSSRTIPLGDQDLRVTASAGMVRASGTNQDDTAAFECCDRALYAAKAAGRNQVKIAQWPQPA
ncbi:GGDEF domain-containing response regulator [Rubripirellula lacrimiformis]|nr:GGDEF domain-containing response regulator [Rubripirellula lacrimiformis]